MGLTCAVCVAVAGSVGFLGAAAIALRFLPVHPHFVGGAHDLFAVDVNTFAVIDVVADFDVDLAHHAATLARFVAFDVVDEALVVKVDRFAQSDALGLKPPTLV